MVYFSNNKLSAQNTFSLFISPRELHNVSSFNAKAIEQLVTLPRQYYTMSGRWEDLHRSLNGTCHVDKNAY